MSRVFIALTTFFISSVSLAVSPLYENLAKILPAGWSLPDGNQRTKVGDFMLKEFPYERGYRMKDPYNGPVEGYKIVTSHNAKSGRRYAISVIIADGLVFELGMNAMGIDKETYLNDREVLWPERREIKIPAVFKIDMSVPKGSDFNRNLTDQFTKEALHMSGVRFSREAPEHFVAGFRDIKQVRTFFSNLDGLFKSTAKKLERKLVLRSRTCMGQFGS
ncbi:MAG: hypothetical protein SGJ18_08320 [Pseudomonadota bacterium]|nr:hypothetical protein [Pseudomonadota bacterium]